MEIGDIIILAVFGIIIVGSIIGLIFFMRGIIRDHKNRKKYGAPLEIDRSNVRRTLVLLFIYVIAYLGLLYLIYTLIWQG